MGDFIPTEERLNDIEVGHLYDYCRTDPEVYKLLRRLARYGALPGPPYQDEPIRIFSGDYSRDMWDNINAIRSEPVKNALYLLGCRLQEFEARMERRL